MQWMNASERLLYAGQTVEKFRSSFKLLWWIVRQKEITLDIVCVCVREREPCEKWVILIIK